MEDLFFDREDAEDGEDAIAALKGFEEIFSTEKDWMEHLLSQLFIEAKCKKCQSQNIRRVDKSRDYFCNDCGDISSLTAGTFFTGIRKAGPHLKLIMLLEKGIKFNAFQIHEQLGIAYSTCLNLIKKLSMVIEQQMEDFSRPIFSASFLTIFKKRSRLTPIKEHPQAEQRMAEKAIAGQVSMHKMSKAKTKSTEQNENRAEKFDCKNIQSLNPIERKVFSLIETGKIHLDEIIIQSQLTYQELILPLFNLERLNLIKRMPADFYICKMKEVSECSSKIGVAYSRKTKEQVKEFVDFMHKTFDGISRKYLQNYLALYWCLKDKIVWGNGKLLQACLKAPEIPYREIILYETPLDVNFAFDADI